MNTKKLTTIFSFIFIIQFSFCQNIYRAENGKFGFGDAYGNEIISAKYDFVHYFHEGLAGVNRGGKYESGKAIGGKWGFIDTTGKLVIPTIYDEIDKGFLNGFIRVKRNGKWGVINLTGKEIVPLMYEEIVRFSDRLARVNLEGIHYGKAVVGGKYGVIDLSSGKEIIPIKYHGIDLEKFSDGLLWVHINFHCGFIDLNGKEITPFKYSCNDSYFKEGFAHVESDSAPWKHGFIDLSGKEITPLIYDDAGDFSEGYARVECNNKWGFIDKTGSELFPLKYDWVEDFTLGLAKVELNGKYGFVDSTGQEVIPLIYDMATIFYTRGGVEVAMVKQNGDDHFYINKKGKKFNLVKKNEESFFVDEEGNEIKLEWK